MGSSDYVPQVNHHVTYVKSNGKRRPATITTVLDNNTVNLRVGRHGETYMNVPRATGIAAVSAWERTKPGAAGAGTTGGVTLSSYLSLPGASGDYWDTPDHADFDITSDITFVACVRMADYTPTVEQVIVGKMISGGASYAMRMSTTGRVQVFWSPDNSALSFLESNSVVTATDNVTDLWIMAQLDVADVANKTARFWTSTDAPTTAVSSVVWTQLGANNSTLGLATIFSGSAPVEVGSRHAGTVDVFNGRVYYVDVRSGLGNGGNNGTIVGGCDFRNRTVGATTLAGLAGKTWTKHGNAVLV